MNKHNDTPQVWVGCWEAYSAGHLHGKWIDATQDPEDIDTEIAAVVASSPVPNAEEVGIFDTENMEGMEPNSCRGEDIARLGEFIAERGVLGAKVAAYYGGNLDDAIEAFERFCGEFDSLEDYAEEFFNETHEVPKALAPYIDYELVARDLDAGGDVVTFDVGGGRVAVFSAG